MSTLQDSLTGAEERAALADEFINEDEEGLYEEGDLEVGDHVNTRRRKQTWDSFCEQHDKLVRSLKRSFESETLILGHCRRLKDNLVEKAVQLRAALHQKQIDNETISALREQAEHASNEAAGLREKEKATVAMLAILRKEITDLKKKIHKQEQHFLNMPQPTEKKPKGARAKRASRDDGSAATGDDASSLASGLSATSPTPPSQIVADPDSPNVLNVAPQGGVSFRAELAKNSQRLSSPLRSKTAREPALVKLTPFMRWKQNNSVITPNTPTASPHFFSTYGFDPVGKTQPTVISTQRQPPTRMERALRRQQRDPVDL